MKQLKSFVLLAVLLLTALPLAAEPVDAVRALDAARAFFQHDRNFSRRMAPVTQVSLSSAPLTKAGEAEPAYRIFNRAGGGFVIIAGDDACRPVLAYSYDRNFGTEQDMPENLREWLDDLEEQVAFVRSEQRRTATAVAAWTDLLVTTKVGATSYQPALKHETPTWSQGAPFNSLTPMVDGKHAVIGCVPLAMGMIMRFYGYPAKGEGTLESYSYDMDNGTTCQIPGYDLGDPYEWDKIKYNYADGYTEAEGAAVAHLVYDCGVAVQAKFDESTSASTQKMAGCGVTYFGFDPGTYYYKRALFSDAEWLDMLKEELQARPILYSARREGGGHAFLVDGYDENDYLSVNWGWGGSSNGYYALSAFTPSENRKYVLNHGAVFGLKPKEGEGGSPRSYLYYQAGTSSSSGTVYNGLTPSETIRPHKSFTMKAGFLYNGGLYPFTGEYVIVLCDKDGRVKENISSVSTFNSLKAGSGRGYSSISCFMQSYPLEGDKVCLMYRSDEWPDGVWEFPHYDLTATDITAEIPVTDDTKLADVTSFSFNKTSGDILIETKDLVEWALTGPSGAVTDGVTYEMTALKIASASLPAGSYTLTLKRADEQLTLTLKLGSK